MRTGYSDKETTENKIQTHLYVDRLHAKHDHNTTLDYNTSIIHSIQVHIMHTGKKHHNIQSINLTLSNK